ncbi:hypothetical protein [Propionibacterium australiense]|uniref:Uncharacterized protein n=1 Tax=Propionibacterium australiense TaxID=119981 RepID=A0A8B3FM25_9ACTN|nr:hypothetical protein [Propionibacterium australiense]RLP11017.1 hypothetical protein D9T14_04565 [Propionibacterium australiense]RLP13017.1 hypothetical protein D7U36_00900 [Propionibacterium australiense]VEH91006.1 Uncharacterised protein [Propionibacterium australiense]
MPSFRVELPVHGTRPGHHPSEVLDLARRALPGQAHCDDVHLAMPRGTPVVTVRFSIAPGGRDDEDARARACAEAIRELLGTVAEVSAPRMCRRRGGNWLVLEG